MEVGDGASGLAKWVLIPPFSDARLEGVLQFQRDYTLCQDAGEGNASNSGGSESSSSWLLKTGVFLFSQIYFGVRRSLAFQSLVVSQCYGGLFLMGIGFWPLPPILFLFTLFI